MYPFGQCFPSLSLGDTKPEAKDLDDLGLKLFWVQKKATVQGEPVLPKIEHTFHEQQSRSSEESSPLFINEELPERSDSDGSLDANATTES